MLAFLRAGVASACNDRGLKVIKPCFVGMVQRRHSWRVTVFDRKQKTENNFAASQTWTNLNNGGFMRRTLPDGFKAAYLFLRSTAKMASLGQTAEGALYCESPLLLKHWETLWMDLPWKATVANEMMLLASYDHWSWKFLVCYHLAFQSFVLIILSRPII